MGSREVEDMDALSLRWVRFVELAGGQLDEVLAEADRSFEALITERILLPAPLAEAQAALEGRLRALGDRVDAAWARLEADIDALVDATGDTRLYARREALEGLRWELHGVMERRGEELVARKAGKAARALAALAERELEEVRERGVPCSACGAALRPAVPHEVSLVTCPGCQVMTELSPGPLTQQYLGGGSRDAIGREAALEAGAALREAEQRFEALESPGEQDAREYEAAARAYWCVYLEARGRATPGWTPDRLEAEVEWCLAPVRERARRALRRTPSYLWEVAAKAGPRPRRPRFLH